MFEDHQTKQERTVLNSEKAKFNKSVIVLNDDKKTIKRIHYEKARRA